MEQSMKIDTIQELQDFIQAAIQTPSEVMVKQSGYIVNGKSILGLLSLDLSKEIIVCVNTGDYSNFTYFM